MRKWLFLAAVALVFSGCGGGQNEKAKTETKQTQKAQTKSKKAADKTNTKSKKTSENLQTAANGGKKGKNRAAIQQMASNKQDVVLFINRAEHTVEDVYYAAMNMRNGKTVKEGGFTYRQLPNNLDTKDKIITYFSSFWSKAIAIRMYDNINTKIVNNQVYVAQPEKDYPVLISRQNTNVQVVHDEITATVSDITIPALAAQRSVRYHLIRDPKTKRYHIDNRSGAYGEEMFK